MKPNFKVFAILLINLMMSCKNEVQLSEYRFEDKDLILNCEGQNSKLINEAIYTFEDILKTKFVNNVNTEMGMDIIYSKYLNQIVNNRIRYEDLVTDRILEVFHVLKSKEDLWDLGSNVSKLDYHSSFFNCLAISVTDDHLKTTLNALMVTNSMSPSLFADPLMTRFRFVENNDALRAYIAFDLFYAKLFDIEEENLNK